MEKSPIQLITLAQLSELMDKREEKLLSLYKKVLQQKDSGNSTELLTREETCKFLKINSSTLWDWTNKGKVKAYGIGNRRYYKKEEILSALKTLNK